MTTLQQNIASQINFTSPSVAEVIAMREQHGLCGAYRKGDAGGYCQTPAEDCMKHCGGKVHHKDADGKRIPGEHHWCGHRPMANGRCQSHGGKVARGIASGQFKDGRYSKYLPKDLAKATADLERDSNYVSLCSELALIRARAQQVLGTINRCAPAECWDTLKGHLAAIELAEQAQDWAALRQALPLARQAVRDGESSGRAWQEVYDLIRLTDKLAGTETKRLALDQLTKTQAAVLLAHLTTTLKEFVPDQKMRAAFCERMADVMGMRELYLSTRKPAKSVDAEVATSTDSAMSISDTVTPSDSTICPSV